MMTIEQIKKRLEDANLRRVAENSGVHPATVYRFMQEESKPLYETVKALSDYLKQTGGDAWLTCLKSLAVLGHRRQKS